MMFSAGAAAPLAFPQRIAPPPVEARGMGLRHAAAADVQFLLELHRSFRMDELAVLSWPLEQKHAFLDQQFAFQHRNYMAAFPNADFLVVELEGRPMGRLYLDVDPSRWHVIDIGLLPESRGAGMGTTLLSAIQRHAAASGAGVVLHVEQHNVRAHRLYRRLSFRDVDIGSTHIRMEWQDGACAAATPTQQPFN